MIFSDLIVFSVLPFILIFVLVFAVLQKSKILGEGKNQNDALVSFVIAMLLVAVPGPQKVIIVNMMPWLAVALSVLLIFFILYGFVAGDMKELPAGMKWTFVGLAFVFVIALVIFLTNIEELFYGFLEGTGGWLVNWVIFVLVIGALAWVVMSAGKK